MASLFLGGLYFTSGIIILLFFLICAEPARDYIKERWESFTFSKKRGDVFNNRQQYGNSVIRFRFL